MLFLNLVLVDGVSYASSSRITTSDYDYESSYTKFEAFLTRAASCQNILLPPTSAKSVDRSRRIILLEDLPNLGHLDTRAKFHAALKAIVEAPDPNPVPVIIIVSDSGIRGEAGDERLANGMWRRDQDGAVDLYSVLSKDLLSSQFVTQVR